MVTSKDVAKAANVSHMTVSRAFQPNSSIKKDTREKVLAVAKKLNYIPNYNAKSLVMNRNFSIGLFFSSMEGTSEVFLGDLVNQIYQQLPHNYLLSVNSIDKMNINGAKNSLIEAVIGRFDGVIIATQSEKDDAFIDYLHKLNLPIVVMNRYIENTEIYNVSTNESVGIQEMVDYLVECGIKTVGTIKGFSSFSSAKKRYQKLVEACNHAGITIVHSAIEEGKYTLASGYEAMKKIIANNDVLPEVIVCGNDDMAIGAIKACNEERYLVPNELAIIGFDDTNYAKYMNPALTTIHKPYREMAQKSMEILLDLLEEKAPKKYKYNIDSGLIVRDSVR
ncbi:LacI family DNA-binding transcriptional regulator [Enterococcus hermanniensis]|uniref:LacI family transcriptional regulator n=1 Tax=Enterococcus hermanniensis TaxID=249189 RepID=A0A1L8TPG7_9ENTE|nr:LacI family DNA-binding transcriptional regulator [Enterococcus hermanniensis]OJG46123.1 LacI family transcriptional regulator [Enterococcus hermanniensis]